MTPVSGEVRRCRQTLGMGGGKPGRGGEEHGCAWAAACTERVARDRVWRPGMECCRHRPGGPGAVKGSEQALSKRRKRTSKGFIQTKKCKVNMLLHLYSSTSNFLAKY